MAQTKLVTSNDIGKEENLGGNKEIELSYRAGVKRVQ
jgi:hypothetical protein